MPRPIVLTQEIKQKAIEDFSTILDGMKMSDGKLSYNRSFSYETGNAIVWLTQEAYRKTVALVVGFSDEVAWHGTVSRVDGGNDSTANTNTTRDKNSTTNSNEFIIEDIFIYPQEVTSSTVNTNQAAYTEWLYGLDDATFNKIRMQGHSHVNMGVNPSGVDDKHRQQILDQLESDMFYIFMIWNKSLSVHTLIYDMARNVLYEDKDVSVKLLGDEAMDAFLADAKEKVQKQCNKKEQSDKSQIGKSRFGKDQLTKAQTKKRKPSSKKQKLEEIERAERMERLGLELGIDPDELEELIQFGLDVDSEEMAFYSRYGLYDKYGLGGGGWRL